MIASKAIRYHKAGDPLRVLQLDTINVNTKLEPTQVLIRWLMAPVNPLDINRIQGAYVLKNEYPQIAGSEGVGKIVKVGSGVDGLKVGDKVIGGAPVTSTWTEFGVSFQDGLQVIHPNVDLVSAATLKINPPTAYIMLKEYEDLAPGDYVIQNSANSAVGRCVIQQAKAFGLKTVNIVRERPNVEELKKELIALGADFVFTEEEFKNDGRKFVKSLDRPIKLACNGVGGRSALAISAVLGYGRTCVTYGGMSMKPSEFSTSSLLFNDLKAVGVAVTSFVTNPKNEKKVKNMFNELQDLILSGQLTPPPAKIHPLSDFKQALRDHLDGRKGKQMLLIGDEASAKL
ncbi:unnamed protein product [Bursaphelenchus xylophilus]|uniref:Enoyl-[acyl-carrier-protein] reductase, mitochondrial n=1 Tax=Bursaphelenchus xylophilus TaxID=6326 RepID=A0A1I7S2Y1_BURXY|nr:unnamed protein product [Bursaphelenchus xylophilus]CAG9116024.1 unnamed protein product [Bursaphelenchus xylophilus]